jgi:ParB/RepB/Spo0J family partition protein
METIDPTLLRPHKCNRAIYGEEDVTELVEQIQQSGWIKPLVVTDENLIISGHRRWRAAILLGASEVPVEHREFDNDTATLEALLLENCSRHKTVEQRVREARCWRDIERERARQRMLAGVRQVSSSRCLPETTGEVRDIVAQRVGMGSGKSYERAMRVVAVIDDEAAQGPQ